MVLFGQTGNLPVVNIPKKKINFRYIFVLFFKEEYLKFEVKKKVPLIFGALNGPFAVVYLEFANKKTAEESKPDRKTLHWRDLRILKKIIFNEGIFIKH